MRASTAAPEVVHLTVAERIALGRAAREETARSGQSALDVHASRDPIGLLEAQAAPRVQELLPIRYGRMLASPFAFYRGAAAIMASDLATAPRTGLQAQLCGDAHLLNFGGYASPERTLVFGINDFDETLPGPFEWDVKRLATSTEIAARDRGFGRSDRVAAVLATVCGYRETMRQLAKQSNLDVWYAHADVDSLVAELHQGRERKNARSLKRAAANAPLNDRHALARLMHVVDGEPRIVSDPPLTVPVTELGEGRDQLQAAVRTVFRAYRHSLQSDRRDLLEEFRFADLARRVIGVGSVGLRSWILLLVGRDKSDPLFLQLKQAEASVLEPYLGRGDYASHAQRVVRGQRVSQASSDIFLGWTRVDDLDGAAHDFYVRQLRDWKLSVNLTQILPRALAIYGRWCGATLARAHARSGDRIAIASYLGKGDAFDRAVAHFANAYADLTEQDHAALTEAVRSGRLPATEGV
jgi:uncharacterized protein (DUF2252 family)